MLNFDNLRIYYFQRHRETFLIFSLSTQFCHTCHKLSHFDVVTIFRSIYADLRTFLISVTFVTEREIVITDRKLPPRKIFRILIKFKRDIEAQTFDRICNFLYSLWIKFCHFVKTNKTSSHWTYFDKPLPKRLQ